MDTYTVGQSVRFWLGDVNYNPVDPGEMSHAVHDRAAPFDATVTEVMDDGRVSLIATDHEGNEHAFTEVPVTDAGNGDQHANPQWPNGYATPLT